MFVTLFPSLAFEVVAMVTIFARAAGQRKMKDCETLGLAA
jgi:hypothetical protein